MNPNSKNTFFAVKLGGAFMMRIYIILSKEEQKVFSTPPILTNFFWRIKKP
ncbi:hypothetical protein [uncultured Gammaproteobacteria bacterium]|nr:hypothetical protein [uncultured Gammaproteobacteria bacterium]